MWLLLSFFFALTELTPIWAVRTLAVIAAVAPCTEAFRVLLLRNGKKNWISYQPRREKREEAETIWF